MFRKHLPILARCTQQRNIQWDARKVPATILPNKKANVLALFHEEFPRFNSYKTDRLQLFFGGPLFLLPWGWKFKAFLATWLLCFLRVWQSSAISGDLLMSLYFVADLPLLIALGHQTLRIDQLRHLLTNTWSVLWNTLVGCQVS